MCALSSDIAPCKVGIISGPSELMVGREGVVVEGMEVEVVEVVI
jgi:hypothetical protein